MSERLKRVRIGSRRLDISRLADGASPDDWPTTSGSVKAAAPAPAPALSLNAEVEDRAEVKKSESVRQVQKPAGKKFKVKLKPRFAAPKAKGKQADRKRLLRTR